MDFLCFDFFTVIFGDFNHFLLLLFKGYSNVVGTFYSFVIFKVYDALYWKAVCMDRGRLFRYSYADS